MIYFRKKSKTTNPDSFEAAWGYALFLLGIRARTEKEMKEKLYGRGFVEGVIKSVIERLYNERLLDDASLAQVLVESYIRFKLYGFYYLKQKLVQRGIEVKVSEQVLENSFSESVEYAVGKKLLKKNMIDITTKKGRDTFGAQLQRRGFRMGVIAKLLSEARGEG